MQRKKKKGRPSLLDLQRRHLKQQQQNPNDSSNRSTRRYRDYEAGDDDHNRVRKKQRVNLTDERSQKATDDALQGLPMRGPTTPLPDRKLLVFILDRIQKKDTHGVFSEPVDPEELPDYHDIIEHPMDFGTVRKKLDGVAYANLEEFERDIFLICSNAMQYNSSDSIYFRQARAMQDLAQKDFDNLRQDSDTDNDESQPKVVRRGRPPKKSLNVALGGSPPETLLPKTSSDAALATGGDKYNLSNGYNLRKGSGSYKLWSPQGSQNNEVYTTSPFEWGNEFPASVVKSVLRSGNKRSTLDDKRRETYKHSMSMRPELPVLGSIESEPKQLIAIGLHTEHSYARSLAQFAANLGPVVWKIAAKKIASVLPQGLDFGPGWIGENEVAVRLQYSSPNELKLPVADCNSTLNRSMPPSTSGLNIINGSCSSGPSYVSKDKISFLHGEHLAKTSFNRISFLHGEHLAKTSFNSDGRERGPRPDNHSRHNYILSPDGNGFGGESGPSSQLEVAKQAMCSTGIGSDGAVLPKQCLGRAASGDCCYFSTPPVIHSFNEGNTFDGLSKLHTGTPLPQLSGADFIVAPGVRKDLILSEQGLYLNCHQDFTAPYELSVGYPAQVSSNSSVWNDSQKPDLALQL